MYTISHNVITLKCRTKKKLAYVEIIYALVGRGGGAYFFKPSSKLCGPVFRNVPKEKQSIKVSDKILSGQLKCPTFGYNVFY